MHIYFKNKVKVRITKANYWKLSFLGIIASYLRTHIHKVITSWRY